LKAPIPKGSSEGVLWTFGKSNPDKPGRQKVLAIPLLPILLSLLLFVAAKSSQKPLAAIELTLYCCPGLHVRPVLYGNIGFKQKLPRLPRLRRVVGDF
jgi:hypothetical protein